MVLPHRSPEPLRLAEIQAVARRSETLGFNDLWVTENTLDDAFSIDPMVALTYAAAVTTRIRLGVAVIVLPVHSPIHVAHQAASLDFISNGRSIIGVGLGREEDYHDFQVPFERRVRRFKEGIELVKALWTQKGIDYQGEFFKLRSSGIGLKPIQKPHPPLWLGGMKPEAIARAATLGDGWMGSGAQTIEAFSQSVPMLRMALEKAGRDPKAFTISKRIFIAVDKDPKVARSQLERWFREVYRRPELTETGGIYGSPEQVREKLERFAALGVDHLLLNAVSGYGEQVDALAEVISLP